MKEFCLNYLDQNGEIRTIYIRAWTRDEAIEKFRRMKKL